MKAAEIISVPVTDQRRAKDFYLKLGLTLIIEAPMGEQWWMQLGFPNQETSLTLVNWFPKMPAGSLQGLVFLTDDIAKEIEELTAKGIVVSPIDETPWGKFAHITDPDGNGLSLHEK